MGASEDQSFVFAARATIQTPLPLISIARRNLPLTTPILIVGRVPHHDHASIGLSSPAHTPSVFPFPYATQQSGQSVDCCKTAT